MIPRYHGRWSITEYGRKCQVLVVWDGERRHYLVREVGATHAHDTHGRNGIRRWLRKVKAEPVDGQQPVA